MTDFPSSWPLCKFQLAPLAKRNCLTPRQAKARRTPSLSNSKNSQSRSLDRARVIFPIFISRLELSSESKTLSRGRARLGKTVTRSRRARDHLPASGSVGAARSNSAFASPGVRQTMGTRKLLARATLDKCSARPLECDMAGRVVRAGASRGSSVGGAKVCGGVRQSDRRKGASLGH